MRDVFLAARDVTSGGYARVCHDITRRLCTRACRVVAIVARPARARAVRPPRANVVGDERET